MTLKDHLHPNVVHGVQCLVERAHKLRMLFLRHSKSPRGGSPQGSGLPSGRSSGVAECPVNPCTELEVITM